MRVVVWNIANRDRAFDALRTLEADIALLNEARPPGSESGLWHEGTVGRDSAQRKWSSAILSPHAIEMIEDARPTWRGSTRNVPFECSRPGTWIAGAVGLPSGLEISAVSLYGVMDELSDASVHRSLSELSPIIDDRRYRKNVIIGGDLNTGTQWAEDDQFLARDANVLQRFEALGLVDCLAAMRPTGRLEGCPCTYGEDCTHTRTRRDPRWPMNPYQTDYLFASRALAARLVSCQALADDHWFSFSDHAPIVADFELA